MPGVGGAVSAVPCPGRAAAVAPGAVTHSIQHPVDQESEKRERYSDLPRDRGNGQQPLAEPGAPGGRVAARLTALGYDALGSVVMPTVAPRACRHRALSGRRVNRRSPSDAA